MDDPRPENERLWSLRATLGELIARVEQLPHAPHPTDDVDSPTYHEIRAKIGPRFPSLGYYHDLLNTLDMTADPHCAVGDVIDDLADICLDLLDGLRRFQRGHRREAAGSWLGAFRMHWGSHVVGALRAVHDELQATGWRPPEVC